MNHNIQSVLVIGSGPVVIGQSSEYDYSGAQACRALKAEGIRVVLVNSNPAALMCGREYADAVYIEPLRTDVLKRVIEREQPDSILPTVGGDLGLALALELHNSGYLEEKGVRMLSVTPELVQAVQDRGEFADMLREIGEPSVAAEVVGSTQEAEAFAEAVGLPVLIRPAYSPDGQADVFCCTREELRKAVGQTLERSLLRQVRLEQCIAGWKELEYEILRDGAGNCVCVCNMENIDPMGIHTGDSIIVAPAQTLTEAESERLRAAAQRIVSHLGVVGSCNLQFALKPDSEIYAVIEVDPRVSRSSALVSKVTGYPIAEVAVKVAIGYRLYEIENKITGCTTACSEPAIDYCCVKFPKWSFESFDEVSRTLGTAMRATGETLAFGTSFELAFMKALRSMNSGALGPALPKFRGTTREELLQAIADSDDERIFAVYEALKRDIPQEELYQLTKIDSWFLTKLKNIADLEQQLEAQYSEKLVRRAKAAGFPDEAIMRLSGKAVPEGLLPKYKMVDTCAAEFDALRPYFYSAWDDDDEARMFRDYASRGKRKVLVVGSGPATVGQGSELEYCNTHVLKTLRELGCYTLCANNNPEAVSTDFESSDRLYFEPLSAEDIRHILAAERPWGIFTQFAGENALPLLRALRGLPLRVLGADLRMLERTATKDALRLFLRDIDIPFTTAYPFSVTGIEADVLCDGESILIPGISEHIEKSGVIHAGDSISVYPTLSVEARVLEEVAVYAEQVALSLGIQGIFNMQFVLHDNRLFVTDVSLSALRNIPFISKATGLPIMSLAARCMLGEKLRDRGVYPVPKRYAVRLPVFSFDKLSGADPRLDERMKSTGEVMGLAGSFEDALKKALTASGMRIKHSGAVLFSVRDADKQSCIGVAEQFAKLGFKIIATAGTAKLLNANYVPASSIHKLCEAPPNILDAIHGSKCVYIVSTSEKHKAALEDDRLLRRAALEKHIPVFTNLDTARVFAHCLAQDQPLEQMELIDVAALQREEVS